MDHSQGAGLCEYTFLCSTRPTIMSLCLLVEDNSKVLNGLFAAEGLWHGSNVGHRVGQGSRNLPFLDTIFFFFFSKRTPPLLCTLIDYVHFY